MPTTPFIPALGRHAAKRARGYGPGGEEDVGGAPTVLLDFVAAAEAARLQVSVWKKRARQ